MGSADWTVLTDSLATASLDRGATYGIARPSGGGDFVYGFNSLDLSVGVAAMMSNQTNYAPTPAMKGGRVSGCVTRLPSGGNTGFAPFLFIGLQGPAVGDDGYMLGLADGDPHHIVLRKGALVEGLPDVAPGAVNAAGIGGVLRRSTDTFENNVWLHLRLDMIVNPNGDVILQVFKNDLTLFPLSGAASWAAVAGMDQLVDDQLGINSGSQPYTSGRIGYGFYTADISRRAAFDQIEVRRQL